MMFSSRRFLQKMKEHILLYYYYKTSGWLVFVLFLEEIEDTKKKLWNYLTFKDNEKGMQLLTCSIVQTLLSYYAEMPVKS